jgi:hypothetical protein
MVEEYDFSGVGLDIPTPVKVINRKYEGLIRIALGRYRWSFATKEGVELEQQTPSPEGKYKRAFLLPEDFIVLLNPYGDPTCDRVLEDYKPQYPLLLAREQRVWVNYIGRVPTANFPFYFLDFLEYFLAAEYCFEINGNGELLGLLKQETQSRFVLAKNADALQQPTRVIRDNPFYGARFG